MKSKLLSVEQMKQICVEKNIDFSNIDLSNFISDYQLTLENVNDYNIQLLIEEYDSIESYEFLFQNKYESRNSNFDNDIKYIAFYENKNMLYKSCLINFKEKWCVSSKNQYVFRNVLDYEKVNLSIDDIFETISQLTTSMVFDWESSENYRQIDDPMAIKLFILYEDNTCFEISCSGIFSDFVLPNYKNFVEYLFAE